MQALLEEFESTRHHYDPEAVKRVQQHARAARIATADRHTNFNTCMIEAQSHLVRVRERERERESLCACESESVRVRVTE